MPKDLKSKVQSEKTTITRFHDPPASHGTGFAIKIKSHGLSDTRNNSHIRSWEIAFSSWTDNATLFFEFGSLYSERLGLLIQQNAMGRKMWEAILLSRI